MESLLDDCTYYPDFFTERGYDHVAIGEALAKIPLADRTAPHMRYRGHELHRSKFFLVDSLELVPIYSYPGFQYRSVIEEYKPIASYPMIAAIQQLLPHKTNHVIGTLYRDGSDNIGFHTDKTKTIDTSVPIYIFSFMQQRPLTFRHIKTGTLTEVPMKPGSLFVLGHKTNANYQHAILAVKDKKLEPRLSLIFRQISNLVPMKKIQKLASR